MMVRIVGDAMMMDGLMYGVRWKMDGGRGHGVKS